MLGFSYRHLTQATSCYVWSLPCRRLKEAIQRLVHSKADSLSFGVARIDQCFSGPKQALEIRFSSRNHSALSRRRSSPGSSRCRTGIASIVSENGLVMSDEKTADWCAKHTSKPTDTPTGYLGWGKLEVILLILLLAGLIAFLKLALFS